MAERADRLSPLAEGTADQADCERLIVEVGRFIAKNAHADRAEERRTSRVAERSIERYGENFRRDQRHHADLESRQLAQAPKNSIDPVGLKTRDTLPVDKPPEHGAVALLFSDEKLP